MELYPHQEEALIRVAVPGYEGIYEKEGLIMKKWRKNIFSAIAFTSFFLVLGSVGAMERNTISFEQGAVQMFGFMASLIFFTYLAGGFE